jgi:hypothetical protein
MAIVFLAGPLSGLIVQPLIGICGLLAVRDILLLKFKVFSLINLNHGSGDGGLT